MKKLFIIMMCMAFTALSSANAATGQDYKKEPGYISLNSSTTKEVEPNFASVTFAVENTASDALKATKENNEISNKIVSELKQKINPNEDVIKTNNFSVRPVYTTNRDGKRQIKNYTAVNSIKVETKNIKKIGEFINIAINNGANRTEGLSYSYKNETNMCKDLYSSLMQEIMQQANAIAKSAGTTLDGIKNLHASCSMDSVYTTNTRLYAKALSATADSASMEMETSTPVEAGKVKLHANIGGDFYVK